MIEVTLQMISLDQMVRRGVPDAYLIAFAIVLTFNIVFTPPFSFFAARPKILFLDSVFDLAYIILNSMGLRQSNVHSNLTISDCIFFLFPALHIADHVSSLLYTLLVLSASRLPRCRAGDKVKQKAT